MLFPSTELVGVRIGIADAPRQAQLYIPGEYGIITDGLAMTLGERGTLIAPTGKQGTDISNACIHIIVRYNDTRSAKRYLAFVPDACITGEGNKVDLASIPAFANAYVAYQKILKEEGWGIYARDVAGNFVEKPIQQWVVADMAPLWIGAVMVLIGAATYEVGDKVAVKGTRRKGTDKMSYNGIYRVAKVVDDATAGTRTVFLAQSQGGDAASVKVNGKLQVVGLKNFPIQNWSWFRAGTHKRGGSFGRALGRRLTRALLDP
jgi:hypothetical protein